MKSPWAFARRIGLSLLEWARHPGQSRYTCPICSYYGPFRTVAPATGRREHAQCPYCKALERHRIQYLVLEKVLADLPCGDMRMLHFAPEAFLQPYFRARFGSYQTADLHMAGVDHKVNITALPFADASYDFVFASHVLEHIRDDRQALSEIRRILAPGGVAILPVPLVGMRTVEYPEANPAEDWHVRAPGYEDYYSRYESYFRRINLYGSDDFPARWQLYIYGDRNRFPTAECPWRTPMPGDRHADVVPVCYR